MNSYLTYYDYEMFEKFLNPTRDGAKRERWLTEYNSVFEKYLKNGLNLPMDVKKRFCVLLMLYPMKENEEKTFFRLDDNQSVGYLSKYLIKKAYSCNVPKAIIEKYSKLKDDLRSSRIHNKNHQKNEKFSLELERVKMNLHEYTYMILDICYEKNSRSGKLDNLILD